LEADGPVEGIWDPARLDQVLTNLLTNALKYSSVGEDVHLSMRELDGHATISVSDQGIGMIPQEQAKLFVPFQLAAPARMVSSRIGLGLHIVAEIVKRAWRQHGDSERVGEGQRLHHYASAITSRFQGLCYTW
jgi:signal transduction histidine kinase